VSRVRRYGTGWHRALSAADQQHLGAFAEVAEHRSHGGARDVGRGLYVYVAVLGGGGDARA